MKHWLAALIDVVFPPTCPLCDAVYTPSPVAPVCATCQAGTQWLSGPVGAAHVAAPACAADPGFAEARAASAWRRPAWDSLRAVCRFDGPVVDAVHRLKYRRRTDLGAALGRLLVEAAFATGPHDLVIPVPLASRRLRTRGYNQAHLLMRPVAAALRAPLAPLVLRRIRETPAQVGLSAVARKANVRGAFAIDPRRRAAVAGKRCLLIDDVMTTGATLAACARPLARAGASAVHALVLAMA